MSSARWSGPDRSRNQGPPRRVSGWSLATTICADHQSVLSITPARSSIRRVTLPLMLPGILAGAMLAFIVSLDDVIITLFVSGPGETTLPLYILGQIRRGVTPEINAVSTVFVGISVILVTLIFLFGKDDK